MIRFACPRCKTVIERADQEAGAKFACTGCGQRLQVPGSINKTVMGDVNWQGAAPLAEPPPAGDVQIRLVHGREHVTWPCPLCQAQVSVAVDLGQVTVRCPQCTRRIDVPRAPTNPAQQIKSGPAVPALPPSPEMLPLAEPPRVRAVADDRRDDGADDRPRRRPRYDDDDDFEPRIRRYTASGRPGSEDECARSSTTGFVCSIIGIALLFVAALIWLVMVAEGPRGAGPFVFLILFIGIISFVLGLIGVVFSSRGLDPINQRNRGIAAAGLVCGILGMVVGLLGSIFFFCIGLIVMSRPF